ncbi:MAG: hypothetical protein KF847_01215 [Pirellulales bacterium]|nr:hypothetical protein [Pirellulales bacterium]
MSPFDDEVLSAYLDGEATEAERAFVEERLAADPAARQLLDELRSAADAVRNLPQPALDEQFQRDVLAAIDADRPTAGAARDAREPGAPVWRRPGVRRGLAWGCLAAAASFVLAAFQSDEPGPVERQVAQAPAGDRTRRSEPLDMKAAPPAASPQPERAPLKSEQPRQASTAAAPESVAEGFDMAADAAPTSPATGAPAAPQATTFGGRGGAAINGRDGAATRKAFSDGLASPPAPSATEAFPQSNVAAADRIVRIPVAGDMTAAEATLRSALAAERIALVQESKDDGVDRIAGSVDKKRALELSDRGAASESDELAESVDLDQSATAGSGLSDESTIAGSGLSDDGSLEAGSPRPVAYLVAASPEQVERLVARLQSIPSGFGLDQQNFRFLEESKPESSKSKSTIPSPSATSDKLTLESARDAENAPREQFGRAKRLDLPAGSLPEGFSGGSRVDRRFNDETRSRSSAAAVEATPGEVRITVVLVPVAAPADADP